MPKDITVDKDKFDAVLRRMLAMKPTTAKELSAKLKKDKAKAKKLIQKMDKT
jgi:predicted transcriptional regulator